VFKAILEALAGDLAGNRVGSEPKKVDIPSCRPTIYLYLVGAVRVHGSDEEPIGG